LEDLRVIPCSRSQRKSSVEGTLQRKSHLCIPGKGIARPQSQFTHSFAAAAAVPLAALLAASEAADPLARGSPAHINGFFVY
jgi:hypothetical protein